MPLRIAFIITQVKLVTDPTFEEFKAAVVEFQPTLLYLTGSSSYEQNQVTGLVGPITFKGESVRSKEKGRTQGAN
jgi:hypothetical protein